MNANSFIILLVSLSVHRPRASLWTTRFSSLAFSTLLQIWRFYKFACRAITGKGNIERLCGQVLRRHGLRVSDEGVEFGSREVRDVVWMIDVEFHLSKCLVEEYALFKDVAREQSESTKVSALESKELGREIATGVHYKKRMNIACLPVLTDIITTLVLVETGKEVLIRQSKEDVSSSLHQDLLDDIWAAVFNQDQRSFSDEQSELTLIDEKDSDKGVVDWVKLGFQGKSPETDFRATGLLGLKQLHSFCTTYPVVAHKLVTESGSSQSLQITEPWYPFALVGIHITRTILQYLSAGLLQRRIILKCNGDVVNSVGRVCQDLYDQLLEEFHGYWIGLVKVGVVKDVFAFERVFGEFKDMKGML